MDQMHPAHADPNDSKAAFTEYSHYGLWTLVHIGQFLGTLFLVLALLALARALSRQRGSRRRPRCHRCRDRDHAWYRLRSADGRRRGRSPLSHQHVDRCGGRVREDSAFQVADGLRGLEKGLSGFFHLNNGLTLITLGLSIALGNLFARWLGAIAVLAGLAS